MIEFVELTLADVPAMLQVEQAAHKLPWSENLLLACFGSRYHNVGVWQDQRLLGFYIADSVLDESTLYNICVHPDCQGQGWGRALLEHYQQWSQSVDCHLWWLEVRVSNLRAQRLYLAAGYQQVGERKGYYRTTDGVEDALVMQRQG